MRLKNGQDNQKPEDYLKAFSEFVKNNTDQIEAINIISGRPKDLTRADLKALLLALKQKGFTTEQLNGAISQTTNRDMAADIIGIIRCYALLSRQATIVANPIRDCAPPAAA